MTIADEGNYVFVANHLPAMSSTNQIVAAAISVLNIKSGNLVTNIILPNGSTCVRGICSSPDSKFVYVTHSIGNFHLPTTQLERGWMNTSAFSVIDAKLKKLLATIILDEFDSGAANPWGITCSHDGSLLAICHAGTHEISLIQLPQFHEKTQSILTTSKTCTVISDFSFLTHIRSRIKLPGNGPRAIVATSKKQFAICEYFSDSIAVIDYSDKKVTIRSIKLGKTSPLTQVRKGEMIFNDATFCYQQWQSCASCHPDGRMDGLNWDLLNDGIGNPKNTKSMLLSHITPPAMITGIRKSAEIAVRAGFKYIQFHDVSEEDARCVDAYLKSLKPVPSPFLEDGNLSAKAKEGEKIFKKADCNRCHPPPLFTDCKPYDIGLNSPTKFDTPTLIEIWRTAPYLYDGRAVTIKEVLTKFNYNEMHGKTKSLSTNEIEALIHYILSL